MKNTAYKIKAFLQLLRPGNVLVTGISVLVGAFGCRLTWCAEHMVFAAMSAMLIAGAGNALNDCYDLEIDKANRPKRPLPGGLLSPAFAYIISMMFLILGAGIGFMVSPGLGLLAAVVAALLWLYAARGKRMSIWGNLLVAAICGLAFIYGGMAVGNPWRAAFPAAFALLMHFGREIVKDVQDEKGDRKGGARTTAIALGRKKSLVIAAGSLGLLFFITPLPYIFTIYNWRYLVAALLGVNGFIIWAVRELLTDPCDRRIARLSRLIKLDMAVGMGAIILGSL
ncbi:MAG: geranylgeranylglycerol-phosphate geranylgeranyltransferase [Candidatus Edwardsbacteria bacterium]|nr:geranylgeranylglycerol-phosphate geranylgeranyltransferase [Candidatus Edwardsbacteria bacterium]